MIRLFNYKPFIRSRKFFYIYDNYNCAPDLSYVLEYYRTKTKVNKFLP